MLCQLNDFRFESNGVDLSNIKRSFQYNFENTKLINSEDQWQATASYSQTINLSGKLIKKSNFILDDLQAIAEKKKIVTLAFDDGRALAVLILSIETDRTKFLDNGKFLEQDFQVSLGVVYG